MYLCSSEDLIWLYLYLALGLGQYWFTRKDVFGNFPLFLFYGIVSGTIVLAILYYLRKIHQSVPPILGFSLLGKHFMLPHHNLLFIYLPFLRCIFRSILLIYLCLEIYNFFRFYYWRVRYQNEPSILQRLLF